MKSYYKRNLPHIQPEGADIFITFRLQGSLPKTMINGIQSEYDQLNSQLNSKLSGKKNQYFLNEQKKLIIKFDNYLHQIKSGPHYLKDPKIAQIIADQLHRFNHQKYLLKAYCIMSNHVHILIKPLKISGDKYHSLESIMHSIKSYTANIANEMLNRKGSPFWAAESFDHYARNEIESRKIAEYILNNPVQAGIVTKLSDWGWSYVMDGLLD